MPAKPAHEGFIVHIDGREVQAGELAPLAFSGYAHFTAMQVREGRLRGLDLHLRRLRGASLQLFGQALPDEAVRAFLRRALASGPPDLSLMATVYSPAGEFTAAGADGGLRVLVRTAAPASGPRGPLKLALVDHERVLPRLKHVGEVAKTYYLREAVQRGFDDAAFVDRDGRLSAYSTQTGHLFHRKLDSHSSANWTPVPCQTGHLFQAKLDTMGVTARG